jgi:hypothetical protein
MAASVDARRAPPGQQRQPPIPELRSVHRRRNESERHWITAPSFGNAHEQRGQQHNGCVEVEHNRDQRRQHPQAEQKVLGGADHSGKGGEESRLIEQHRERDGQQQERNRIGEVVTGGPCRSERSDTDDQCGDGERSRSGPTGEPLPRIHREQAGNDEKHHPCDGHQEHCCIHRRRRNHPARTSGFTNSGSIVVGVAVSAQRKDGTGRTGLGMSAPGMSAPGMSAPGLPAVVSERLVALGHLLHVVTTLDRCTETVGGIEQFTS